MLGLSKCSHTKFAVLTCLSLVACVRCATWVPGKELRPHHRCAFGQQMPAIARLMGRRAAWSAVPVPNGLMATARAARLHMPRSPIWKSDCWVAYQPIQDGGFRQPILLTSRRSLESWGGFGPSPSTSCPFPDRGLRLKDQHAKDKSGTPSTSSTTVIRINSRHGHFLGLLPLLIRLEELTATRISAAHGRLHTPGDCCREVMQLVADLSKVTNGPMMDMIYPRRG